MKVKYNPIINEKSITVFPNGVPITIRRDHPNFYRLLSACRAKEWDKIEALSSIEKTVKEVVNASTASDKVEIRNGQVLYLGKPLHNVVTQKIMSMIRDGIEDVNPWVKFVEKLMENPDRNSVEQLYSFLSYKELPIDIDGNVLGYKGVNEDYWSKAGNTNTRVLQGEVDSQGRIWNGVGETIEVERNCVVNNPDIGCAEGVHIGSYDYATNWAGSGRTLLVSFNPKDAVSVPHKGIEKLRACKYVVVADVTDEDSAIKASCVGTCGEQNVVPISDADLLDAVDYALEDGLYTSEVTKDLLEEEGFLPYGSDITPERIQAAIKKLVTATDEDLGESPDENYPDAIDNRIVKYVAKFAHDVTARQIQSSLSGFANVSCKEIVDRCDNMGLNVFPSPDGISKYIIGSA